MTKYEKLSLAYQFYVQEEKRLRNQDVLLAKLADAKATMLAIEMLEESK